MSREKNETSHARDKAAELLYEALRRAGGTPIPGTTRLEFMPLPRPEEAAALVDALVAALREDLIGPSMPEPSRQPPRPAPPPDEVVVSWCVACGKSDYAYDHDHNIERIENASCPDCQTRTMAAARYGLITRTKPKKRGST